MAGRIRPAVADPANKAATWLNRSDWVPARRCSDALIKQTMAADETSTNRLLARRCYRAKLHLASGVHRSWRMPCEGKAAPLGDLARKRCS